jgi:hypothetical protein
VRQSLDELCAALASFDPGVYSGADCAELVECFASAEHALAAARARAALRAGACGAHRHRGFAEASDWLAQASGSTVQEARAVLDTVKHLDACPETRDAVVAGEVSLAQAGEIVRTATDLPGCELELLEAAKHGTLTTVRELARKRRVAAVTPETLYARQRQARELVHWRDELGMVCGRFALPPDVGVPFINRLDRYADRCWRQTRGHGDVESRAACAADALVQLTQPAENETRGGRRFVDLVIVCDLRAYRRGHTHPGEVCQIIGGGPLPVSVVRELVADAFLKAVLHDGVNIHSVAHFGRHIPARLRTALELGAAPDFDGITCVADGCERRYGLQWDHVNPVANGGLTTHENLEPRCRPDHRDKTDRDRKAGLLRAPP